VSTTTPTVPTCALSPLLESATPAPAARHGTDSAARADRLRPLPYVMLPILQASNGPVYIHPDDRPHGVMTIGRPGSGKTAVMFRMYGSDIRDPNASPIVVDPKSELARTCLELTPPDCGKRVWYLDLGHPAFGMSPLRLDPGRDLAEQASAIADNIVQAISDTAEGQVFQSSKRYLYHAVIGALALAHKHGGVAMFEDVFALLLPDREDLRDQAVNACQGYADLDHTTEFFAVVLPAELENNRANTFQRLDPPRNKIETILASPGLRRFFNHPVDIRLRDIVLARDILIIDANMAALGEEGSQVAMHFIFQQIHSLMQGLVHLPSHERPRVCAIFDEAWQVLTMKTIKQAATHREAGLELTIGTQYISQLGATAQSSAETEAIRKGASNLLGSKCLFGLGDPEDAEKATRIAMSVFQTQIRSDLESRELMGVTPEEVLYLKVWHCLASWMSAGARAPRFYGRTFPFPKLRNGPWAEHHLRWLEEQCGPYPEQMPKTYKRSGSSAETRRAAPDRAPTSGRAPATEDARPDGAQGDESDVAGTTSPRADASALASQTGTATARGPEREKVQPLIREAGEVPEVKRSPVRRVLGVSRAPAQRQLVLADGESPESLRELAAYVDPLLGIRKADQKTPSEKLPRLYDEDYAILALLDRVGLALPGMIRRAVMPRVAERTMRGRLHDKLHRHGLVARWPIILRDKPRGALPYLYSITRFGLETAQARQPPAVPPKREFRETEAEKGGRTRHGLHLESWVIELHEQLGSLATDKWRTPRWPAGTFSVPQIGNGRNRRQMTLKDVPRPKHIGIFDVDNKEFARIEPDAICEVHIPDERLTFDLCIEMDLTERVSYNIEKFRKYDAFLTAWWGEQRRYRQLGTRPGVLFVCPTDELALAYAKAADETLRGSLGVTGSAAHERYYPARDHLFFLAESDIHNGSLAALALPPLPPDVRAALDGTPELTVSRVNLLDAGVLRAGKKPSSS
jgi:hypothetical protein